jgi:flagella basal body P-ring formation protein FlgA
MIAVALALFTLSTLPTTAAPTPTRGTASLAEPIEAAARVAIEASLPATLRLGALSIPPAFARGATPDAVRIEWPSAPRAGSARVALTSGALRTYATLTLEAVRPVPVARRRLPRGARVSAEDFIVEARPVDGPARRADAWVGLVLIDDIPAGMALDRRHVALPPPRPRGAEVTVVRRAPGLELSLSGTLERPAELGGPAQVRVRELGRVVTGVLAASDRVELEEGSR